MILLLSAAGQAPFPGVINIDGVGGGLCEHRASLLANHGFATLALAYYQYEDLIQKPTKLHLEYFEEAVNFMLQHTQVVACSRPSGIQRMLLLWGAYPLARVITGGSCWMLVQPHGWHLQGV